MQALPLLLRLNAHMPNAMMCATTTHDTTHGVPILVQGANANRHTLPHPRCSIIECATVETLLQLQMTK
jgi:hypothetical protein